MNKSPVYQNPGCKLLGLIPLIINFDKLMWSHSERVLEKVVAVEDVPVAR